MLAMKQSHPAMEELIWKEVFLKKETKTFPLKTQKFLFYKKVPTSSWIDYIYCENKIKDSESQITSQWK